MRIAAIVLAGGRGTRMAGADKAAVEYRGRPLLEHALDATAGAEEVVVVGDPVPTGRPVTFVRESPRYGGPVAALLAGRDALARSADLVAVLAVDMPHVTATTLARLRAAAEDGDAARDGAILRDGDGRRQLCAVVRVARLDAVRPQAEQQHGMALHRLLRDLDLAEVDAVGGEGRDVDSWADLRDL